MDIGKFLVELLNLDDKPSDYRGLSVGDISVALEASKEVIQSRSAIANWGGVPLSLDALRQSSFIIGAQGSGKTITILSLIMHAVIPQLLREPDSRLLVSDPKKEIVPFLAFWLGYPTVSDLIPMRILNPFDRRSEGWDIAKDVQEDPTTLSAQIAAAFIPPNPRAKDPFFENGARELFAGVVEAFSRKSKSFDLRDVVLCCQSLDCMIRVLAGCPQTAHIPEGLVREHSGINSVLSTLGVALTLLRPVAAIWHRSPKFSVVDFASAREILIFGADPLREEALLRVNEVLFERASQALIAREKSPTRQSWVIVDELRFFANKLRGLEKNLLVYGRDRGVIGVLTVQLIESLFETYGQNLAHTIFGLTGNRAYLRTTSEKTASFCSAQLGQFIKRIKLQSGDTTSESVHQAPVVMPGEFLAIPSCTPENGLQGLYSSSYLSSYWTSTLPASEWPPEYPPQEVAEAYPAFVPRPASDSTIEPWNEDDLYRLGIRQDLTEANDVLAELLAKLRSLNEEGEA